MSAPGRLLPALVLAGLGLLLVLTAARRDLFGDEAFYAACAARPALAYADHPPLTALLVRGGTALLGWTPIGVRALFLLTGLALPLLLAALCRELGGTRADALRAAALVAALPALALMPSLAVPDVPLLVLQAAALLAGLRAVRRDARADWFALGLALGLGLATHLRGVLAPAAFLLGALASERGRAALRRPGARLAAGLTALGALPLLADHLLRAGTSLGYQLGERHAAGLHLDATLEFLATQLLVVVTPLLALLFAAVLRRLAREARAGRADAALALAHALLPLGLYFAASPFADARRAQQHWPLPAYLPLLALTPVVARRAWAAGGARRALAVAAPALGLALTAFVFVDALTGVPGTRVVQRKFRGWSEAAALTAQWSDTLADADGAPPVVADHYVLAAQLELARRARGVPSPGVFVLDHPKNREHGRQPQYARWGLDERGLRRAHAGQRVLLVVDLDATRTREREAWLAALDTRFSELRLLDSARPGWPPRPLELRWYVGRVRAAPPED